MTAMFFRPVVTYPTRCVAPAFFARPAPVAHDFAPLFSLFDESLTQLDNQLRQAQTQFKRPFNPKFDVKETKEAYSVEGELPGFDAKDISIEFLDDGHTLQIKGKTVKQSKSESSPKAVTSEEPGKSVEAAPAAEASTDKVDTTTSETSSLKFHQATVEDDVEEPANASAADTATPSQAVTEAPKTAEQQVAAEQKTQQPEAKKWVSERYTGSFTRSFKFPSKVDQEAVRASLKDGILAITLPFARKPESRKIQIE